VLSPVKSGGTMAQLRRTQEAIFDAPVIVVTVLPSSLITQATGSVGWKAR